MRDILVAGGGIAGVEAALTLGRGLPEDRVTLLAHTDVLRVSPDLLYVPCGVDAGRLDVPLRELLSNEPVHVMLGSLESVDLVGRVAHLDVGTIAFDVIVAAPGAEPLATSGLQVQSVSQAEELREALDEVFAAASADDRRGSIVLRAEADDAWPPPAYELAMLLGARRQRLGVERLVDITLVTAELQPFQWFDPLVADMVVDELAAWGVELATGVPVSRFDDIGGDVVVDFPRLHARNMPGVPGPVGDGWYDVDSDGRVAPGAYVVGDAAGHGYKAAFGCAWQARRVLAALGGDVAALGSEVAGVPVEAVEHHVDLAGRTLRIRLPLAARLHDPWLGHHSTVRIDDGPADRLAGLVVGELLERRGGRSAGLAHRALLSRRAERRPTAGRARPAWSPSR